MNSYTKHILLISALFFGVVLTGADASAITLPPGFQSQTIVGGLNLPTTFDTTPDGRIFIAEKGGTVRVFKNGVLLPTPLITLPNINTHGDRGLLGLAVDSEFVTNGYVYFSYTHENSPLDPTGPKTARIVRGVVTGDIVDPASLVVIVGTVAGDSTTPSCNSYPAGTDCIPSDSSAHSAGGLRFGPDGYLYASLGDGADFTGADPNALHSLDIDYLTGKLLRLNRDGSGVSDNPFFTGDANDNRSKVYAYGIRNSFRFNFRPLNNSIYLGEVGWFTAEEVNIATPGANFGWPCREGYNPAPTYNCSTTNWTDPIYSYLHADEGNSSITGGAFPSSPDYPAGYNDSYIFGDFVHSTFKQLVVDSNDNVLAVNDFATDAAGPVDIQTDENGNLTYISIYTGELRRIVYSTANQAPNAVATGLPNAGTAPHQVNFTGDQSNDPDNDVLTYLWDFQDGTTSTTVNPTHTFISNGIYGVTLTVDDGKGGTDVASITIEVSDNPPNPGNVAPYHIDTVVSPATTYIGSDAILTTTIGNTGGTDPFTVDIEIFDSSGAQVSQYYWENESIANGATKDYQITWFPPAVGLYRVSVGLIYPAWNGLYSWTNEAVFIDIVPRDPVASFNPQLGTTSLSNANPNVDDLVTVTTDIQNQGGAGSALVDFEVWENGVKIYQHVLPGESFVSDETRQFAFQYTPDHEGVFGVNIGVFSPDWSTNYFYQSEVVKFSTIPTPANVNGLDFDGVDDYVDVGVWNIEELGAATLEVVFTADSFAQDMALIAKGNGATAQDQVWQLGVKRIDDTTGELRFGIETSNGLHMVEAGTVTIGETVHVTGVYDGASVKLYKNGVLVADEAHTGTIAQTNDIVWLGALPNIATAGPFDGIVDEMRVWNIARTETQVANTVGTELIGNEIGLIKYWMFNEGFGQIALDSSNSGHHGTLGSTSVADGNDPSWVGGIGNPGGVFSPEFQTIIATPNPVGSNEVVTIDTGITNTGDGAGYLILDIEIYDELGNQVHQEIFDGQILVAGETKQLTFDWTAPASTGNYRIAVGLIEVNWVGLYQWVNNATTISVDTITTPPTINDVYKDSLVSGWDSWSWLTNVDRKSTDYIGSDSFSLRATHNTQTWAGLYLHNYAYNTTGMTNITFMINGGAVGNQILQVNLRDATDTNLTKAVVNDYIVGNTLTPETWYIVSIPLADLNGVDKDITGIIFQGASGLIEPSYYLDEISFI